MSELLAPCVREEIARVLEIVADDGLKHPRDLDVALDAIGAALENQPQWMPISTHPKNTTWCLGWREGWEPVMISWVTLDFGGYFIALNIYGRERIEPTHWMPMPKSPIE